MDSSSPTMRLRPWQQHEANGRQSFREGNYSASLTHFEEASRLAAISGTPKDQSIMLSNTIACRLKLGDIENLYISLGEAKDCVSLNDKWPKAYMRLASVYIALGEHDPRHGHSNDACQALQTVIRLDPSNSEARRMLMAEMRRSYASTTTPSSGTSTSSGGANNPNTSRTSSYEDVDVDVDGTDATSNNSNYPNIRETFVDKVRRKLHNLRQQYDNLSDDGQSAVMVCAALLILYISLGGRFGLGGIIGSNNGGSSGSGRDYNERTTYGDGSAYERFYSSSESSPSSYEYYSYDSRSRGKRNRSPHSSHHHMDEFFVMAFVSMLIAFAMKSAGVPLGDIPIWYGVRRFHWRRFGWW